MTFGSRLLTAVAVVTVGVVGLAVSPAHAAKSAFSIANVSFSHGHANWAFSAPGAYFLTFKATISFVPTGSTSGNVIYHFRVSN